MSPTRKFGAAVLAAVALAVAGCGGDEDEVSASTQWAGELCTAVTTWRDSISDTATALTQNPTQAGLQEAEDDVKSSTDTLLETVQGLGAPDTESGEQAQETLESLSTSLESSIETIQQAVEGVSGVSEALQAVTTVSATVAQLSSELSESLDDLQALGEADDELEQSFREAESCDGVIPADS